MSVSLTLDAVRARTKTVTRRDASTWAGLRPGDQLALIEKGMGLPRGARQVVVATVTVVTVRLEALSLVTEADVAREGFPGMSPAEFVDFWLRSHKAEGDPIVRRIAWRYEELGHAD